MRKHEYAGGIVELTTYNGWVGVKAMFDTVDEVVEKTEEKHSGWRFAAVIVLSVAVFAGIILLAVVLD